METFYQVLHTHQAATQTEILEAYQRQRAEALAGMPDPDTHLQTLDNAYAVLSDASQRAAYDRELGLSSGAMVVAGGPAPIVVNPATTLPQLQQACPHCGELNPVQATVCMACRQQISRSCPTCSQQVVLGQPVCPRCNTYLPDVDTRRMAEALKIDDAVQGERLSSAARVRDLEAGHRTNAVYGVMFWLVVSALCVGAAAAAIYLFNMAANA